MTLSVVVSSPAKKFFKLPTDPANAAELKTTDNPRPIKPSGKAARAPVRQPITGPANAYKAAIKAIVARTTAAAEQK